MNGYFRPLRRKVGGVALVLACLFVTGWIRGIVVGDNFSYCH